jgi:GTP-binding protein HflX
MAALLAAIEDRLGATRMTLDLSIDAADGAGISWLHRNTEVLLRSNRDDGKVVMSVRAEPAKVDRVRARFGAIKSAG